MALVKWMEYKAIVTTGRLNKYTRGGWLLAVQMVAPLVITVAICVRYENILVVDVISSIFLSGYISLVAYFYVKAYFAVGIWSQKMFCSKESLKARSLTLLLSG